MITSGRRAARSTIFPKASSSPIWAARSSATAPPSSSAAMRRSSPIAGTKSPAKGWPRATIREGDYLYGMGVCVDRDYRRLRIGQRLYERPAQALPGMGPEGHRLRRADAGSCPPAARISRRPRPIWKPFRRGACATARSSSIWPNGFEPRRHHQELRSPPTWSRSAMPRICCGAIPSRTKRPRRNPRHLRMSKQDIVRVATVQFQMRGITAKEEFARQVEYFVDVAADYRSDFVVFPELFTLQLLSLEEKALSAGDAVDRLTELYGLVPGIRQRSRGQPQHQHHRRVAPDQGRSGRSEERHLSSASRRLGPHAGENPPDAERGHTGGT